MAHLLIEVSLVSDFSGEVLSKKIVLIEEQYGWNAAQKIKKAIERPFKAVYGEDNEDWE